MHIEDTFHLFDAIWRYIVPICNISDPIPTARGLAPQQLAPSITAQPLVEMAAAALPAGSVALVVTLEIKPDRIEVHAQRICLSAPVLLRAWTAPAAVPAGCRPADWAP
jgi:hypothetical protein